jgi:predicted DCC family thiol-disulfide oxidoreductase YuxK
MSRLVSASRAIACFTTRPTTTRRGVSRAVVRPRAASVSSSTSASASPSWKFRLLYDGACPLCVREVEFLRAKDAGKGKLSLVDIAADDYDASDNAGIDYETAMATIHGLDADKKVYTGVEVFERAYDAVGIGYVYAFTRVPALLKAANAVYDVWAKYRLNVTNRGSLAEHLAAREQRLSGKTCGVDKEACEETTTKA